MSEKSEVEDYSASDPLSLVDDEGELRTLTVPLTLAGQRLDQGLAHLLPDYSRSRLSELIKLGAVRVDGETALPKRRLLGGESIDAQLTPRESETAFVPEEIALEVVFEDACIVVINKPAGLVVHPAAGNWRGTLLNALLFHFPASRSLPRAGIVHRLDKDTTGLMVVAKTESAQWHLVKQLQARSMHRHYWAVVRGRVGKDGTVDKPIGRHPRDRTKMAVLPDGPGAKAAKTHFHVVKKFDRHTLLECRLESGRTHQIRVHLQSIGFPIEADPVYGPPPAPTAAERECFSAFGRQALHARLLTLQHPESGEECTFEAEPPADFQSLLAFVAGLGESF